MNKSWLIGIIITVIIGTPSTIVSYLALIEHTSVLPLVETASQESDLPWGIIVLIVGISFCGGIGVIKLKNRSKNYSGYIPTRIVQIKIELEEKYGPGFNYDDAQVIEAAEKRRISLKDVATFCNMSESKVQKIFNKLADKGVQGFKR